MRRPSWQQERVVETAHLLVTENREREYRKGSEPDIGLKDEL